MKILNSILLLVSIVLSANAQKFTNFTNSNSELAGDMVRAVFVDENNNVWFGTDAGLVLKKSDSWIIYTSGSSENIIPGNVVTDLAYQFSSHSGSELWVATHSGAGVGAYSVDGITSATTYKVGDEGVSLTSNKINALVLDSADVRYFGTDDGLAAFGQGWFYFNSDSTSDPRIPEAEIMAMGARNDSIYIGMVTSTSYKNPGVARIQNEVDGFTGASTYVNKYNLPSGEVYSVFIDSYGYRWFGTNKGVARHIKMKGKAPDGIDLFFTEDNVLTDKTVYAINEDSEGNFWFGTNEGLIILNTSEDFIHYTSNDGLANNNVYDIGFTSEGIAWVATAGGVSKVTNALDINEETNLIISDLKVSPSIIQNRAKLSFNQKFPGNAKIDLYSIEGKWVETIFNEFVPTGKMKLNFIPAGDIQSGIYIFKLNSAGDIAVKKAVIIN